MQVIDQHIEQEVLTLCKGVGMYADGSVRDVSREVLVEHELSVYVNEVLTMQVVCTPSHLVDLVVGRLFSEGMVAGTADIESVYLCEFATRARVMLSERVADFSRSDQPLCVPSCCTGNRTYNEYFTTDDPPAKVVPIRWEPAWVLAAASAFAKDSPLHRRTFGTHSCYLVLDGEVVSCREDLGRHNAFDKVVGDALRKGIDLTRTMVFSSGRIPVDMVMKAIRAGIPVLATKAVPTDATIKLACQFDLTLICSARPDSMMVFNDPAGCMRSCDL